MSLQPWLNSLHLGDPVCLTTIGDDPHVSAIDLVTPTHFFVEGWFLNRRTGETDPVLIAHILPVEGAFGEEKDEA